MNNINFSEERESDQDVSIQGTDEGNYENYRRKSLPEGYTAYNDTRQVNELGPCNFKNRNVPIIKISKI